MAQKPLVAIVGRPNVGKSTLFNRLAGSRISIVDDTPGITRDRIYKDVQWLTNTFTLIDTGGIEPKSEDIILKQMRRQAQLAIETADVILFMVDAKQGVTPDDKEVALMLRRSKKPILLVVNKVDRFDGSIDYNEFYELGFAELVPISSAQMLGLGDLLDEVVKHFPKFEEQDENQKVIRIAVVGKPNVGKSTLVNAILREERVIVSDIPGTTRDAVDTPFSRGEDHYIIIDTAGLRKKGKIEDDSIERYSVVRALGAMKRCDVALILVDAGEGLTEQDTKIAGFVHEQGKASIIVINKWDLIEKDTHTMKKEEQSIKEELSFMNYAPTLFISSRTGQRVHRVLEEVKKVYAHACTSVPMGVLNDVINEAMAMQQPPIVSGKRIKIFFGKQTGIQPPTFSLVVNDGKYMHYSYERYLKNQIRRAFDFSGTDIRLQYQQKYKEDSQK